MLLNDLAMGQSEAMEFGAGHSSVLAELLFSPRLHDRACRWLCGGYPGDGSGLLDRVRKVCPLVQR